MGKVIMIGTSAVETVAVQPSTDLLHPLVQAQLNPAPRSAAAIGELIGITNVRCTPLAILPSQPSAWAANARTVIELYRPPIGKKVVILFESDVYSKPIIYDLLPTWEGTFQDGQPCQVETDADDPRLIGSTKELTVLRYGKASFSLIQVARIIIQGTCLFSRSSALIALGAVQFYCTDFYHVAYH